ncbi:hypothetical protein EP837_02903 [Sphingobium sp. EP60837]|nr:hypothetical protein EP837_02903 [Sphingobium sp. EP60837]
MRQKLYRTIAPCALVFAMTACNGDDGGTASAGSTAPPAASGTTNETGTAAGTGSVASGASSPSGGTSSGIPALVNVNLQNVLNDLSVRLQVDRANIPVNAQIPIEVAANVCGVSVNVLSVSTGGQAACTAKVASSELAQVVQQQVAAGGSVGGGAQGGSTAATGGATTTGGSSTSGASGTSATSSGTSETTTRTP